MIQIIKAIILDIDDTIIDYSKIVSHCYQQTAIELGLKKVSRERISKYFGTPHSLMLNDLWNYKDEKKFERILFKKINSKIVKPFPGAIDVIKKLYKKYVLALLSSKNKKIMYPQLKQINLSTKYFKFVYSNQDTKYSKPDPRVFSKPLKILKLKSSEILYVGDSKFDCIAAKKAKLNFVAVLTGHYSKKEFRKYKVKNDNILKSLRDLPKWLDKNE